MHFLPIAAVVLVKLHFIHGVLALPAVIPAVARRDMGGQLSSWSEYWAPEELLVEQELPVKLPQLGNEGRGRHTLHKRTGGGGDFEMPPEELIKPMLDGLMSVGYSERVARCVVRKFVAYAIGNTTPETAPTTEQWIRECKIECGEATPEDVAGDEPVSDPDTPNGGITNAEFRPNGQRTGSELNAAAAAALLGQASRTKLKKYLGRPRNAALNSKGGLTGHLKPTIQQPAAIPQALGSTARQPGSGVFNLRAKAQDMVAPVLTGLGIGGGASWALRTGQLGGALRSLLPALGRQFVPSFAGGR